MMFGYLSVPPTVHERLPEVLLGRPAVPEAPEEAEVVEGVHVRAAVGVEGDRVAAVAVLLVHLWARPGEVVVDRALRRMGHPHVELGIARGRPGRHADEVVDREVEDLRAVERLEDRLLRLGRDPVQAPDLVVGPPGAFRDLDAVLLQNGLVGQLLLRRRHLVPPLSRGSVGGARAAAQAHGESIRGRAAARASRLPPERRAQRAERSPRQGADRRARARPGALRRTRTGR